MHAIAGPPYPCSRAGFRDQAWNGHIASGTFANAGLGESGRGSGSADKRWSKRDCAYPVTFKIASRTGAMGMRTSSSVSGSRGGSVVPFMLLASVPGRYHEPRPPVRDRDTALRQASEQV